MSYADELPMSIQEELIQMRDDATRMEWRTGDIVQEAIDWNRERFRKAMILGSGVDEIRPVEIMEVYRAVGAFRGKSARTIRDYHSVACFYPRGTEADPGPREKYAVLAFDHFRQAMTLGPDWEDALDWAVKQVDELNRPATVDAMIARWAPTLDIGTPPEGNPDPTDQNPDHESNPVTELNRVLVMVRHWLDKVDLSAGDKEQADEAVAVLSEVASRAKVTD